MMRRKGFTLLEMLIVIIIIVILAGAAVALMNVFFRGQGLRQGAMIVSQAIAEARQLAAETHMVHFVVFSKKTDDGWLEIHQDTNKNGIYDGDQNPSTPDADKIVGEKIDMPKWVVFDYAPTWIGVAPSGFMMFNGGFATVQASTFDSVMNGSSPTPIGDVILRIQGRPYAMCINLDRASGKVRRSFFLNQEQ
jgi:prepilin-type N-terminal cleavage/methylation domain-containing protein